jgi:hypothetical protein
LPLLKIFQGSFALVTLNPKWHLVLSGMIVHYSWNTNRTFCSSDHVVPSTDGGVNDAACKCNQHHLRPFILHTFCML